MYGTHVLRFEWRKLASLLSLSRICEADFFWRANEVDRVT